MPPPLAILNVEEMHGQNDLGLPNQRRWLNHRNIGDEHRRTIPSAVVDSNISNSDCRFHHVRYASACRDKTITPLRTSKKPGYQSHDKTDAYRTLCNLNLKLPIQDSIYLGVARSLRWFGL